MMKDKTEREECEARRKEEEEEEESWGPEWRNVEDSEERNGIFRVDSEPKDEEWEDEMCSRVSRRMGEEWPRRFIEQLRGEPEPEAEEEEEEEKEKEEEEMEEEYRHQTDDVAETAPEEEPEEQEHQQPAGSTLNTNRNPADPIANTPALAEVEYADPGGPRDTFGGEPSLYEGGEPSLYPYHGEDSESDNNKD